MGIMEIFAQLGTSRPTGKPQWLIVGLGNPGLQYENTRHNAGFLAIDTLAATQGTTVSQMKFKGYIGECSLGEQRCLLLKPLTYMNNSGESVVQAMQFYKIDSEHVIILYDDISLPCGKLRIRRKGSAGGHNGIKSIIELTGSEEFPRIKLGVGQKPSKDYDLAKWVLSKFTDSEMELVKGACERAIKSLELMVKGQTDTAMNRYQG